MREKDDNAADHASCQLFIFIYLFTGAPCLPGLQDQYSEKIKIKKKGKIQKYNFA